MPFTRASKSATPARATRSNATASKRSAPDPVPDTASSRAKRARANPKPEPKTSTTRSGKRREVSEEEEDAVEEEEDAQPEPSEEDEEQIRGSASTRGRRRPPPPSSTSVSVPVDAASNNPWAKLSASTLRMIMKEIKGSASTKDAMLSIAQSALGGGGGSSGALASNASEVEEDNDNDDNADDDEMLPSASAPLRPKSPFKPKAGSAKPMPQSKPKARRAEALSKDEVEEGPSRSRTTRSSVNPPAKSASSRNVPVSKGKKRQRDAEENSDDNDSEVDRGQNASRTEEKPEEDDEEDEVPLTRNRVKSQAKAAVPEVASRGRMTRSSKSKEPSSMPPPTTSRRKRQRQQEEEEEEDHEEAEGDAPEERDEEEVPQARVSARSTTSNRASKRIKSTGPKALDAQSPPPPSDDEAEPSDEEEALGPRKRRVSTRTTRAPVPAKMDPPVRSQTRAKSDAVEPDVPKAKPRAAPERRRKPQTKPAQDEPDPQDEPDQDDDELEDDTFEPVVQTEITAPASPPYISPPPEPVVDEPFVEEEPVESTSTRPASGSKAGKPGTTLPDTPLESEIEGPSSIPSGQNTSAKLADSTTHAASAKGKEKEKTPIIDIKGKGKAKAPIESDDEADPADGEPELVDEPLQEFWQDQAQDEQQPLPQPEQRKRRIHVAPGNDDYSSDDEPMYSFAMGFFPDEMYHRKNSNGDDVICLNHPLLHVSERSVTPDPSIPAAVEVEPASLPSATKAASTKKKSTKAKPTGAKGSSTRKHVTVEFPTLTNDADEAAPSVSASGRPQRKRVLSTKKQEALAHAAEAEAYIFNARASAGPRKRTKSGKPVPPLTLVVQTTGLPIDPNDDPNVDAEGDPDDSYLLEHGGDEASVSAMTPVLDMPRLGDGVERFGPPKSPRKKSTKPKSKAVLTADGAEPGPSGSGGNQGTQVLDHVKVPKRVRRSRSGAGTNGSTPSELGGDLDADGSDVGKEEHAEQAGPTGMSINVATTIVEGSGTQNGQQDTEEPEVAGAQPPVPTETSSTAAEIVQRPDEEQVLMPSSQSLERPAAADGAAETPAPAPANDVAVPSQAPALIHSPVQTVPQLPSPPQSHQPSPAPQEYSSLPTAPVESEAPHVMEEGAQQPVAFPTSDIPLAQRGDMNGGDIVMEANTGVAQETAADASLPTSTLPQVETTRSWESIVFDQSPTSPTAADHQIMVGNGQGSGGTAVELMSIDRDDAALGEVLNADPHLAPRTFDSAMGSTGLLETDMGSLMQTMEARGPEARNGDEADHSHNVVDESLSIPEPIPSTSSAAPVITGSTNEPAFGGKTIGAEPFMDEYTTFAAGPAPSASSSSGPIGGYPEGMGSNGAWPHPDVYTQHLYDLKNREITPLRSHSPSSRPTPPVGSSSDQGSQRTLQGIDSASMPIPQAGPQHTSDNKEPPPWAYRPVGLLNPSQSLAKAIMELDDLLGEDGLQASGSSGPQ